MKNTLNNFAFIDSNNVNLGIRELGWRLDFKKFRIYLKEKHKVKKAYLLAIYLKIKSFIDHFRNLVMF